MNRLVRGVGLALGLTLCIGASGYGRDAFAQEGLAIPAPLADQATDTSLETAILAGGCFWGVQGVFQHVDGVSSAVSGYAGGDKSTAQYSMIGRGTTGHAESVKVEFNPRKISYGRILQIYFSVAHDPTQLNRQGPDTGPQYRSAIFPTSEDQARVAAAYVAQLDSAKVYKKPIATKIESGKTFYPAEDYHQDYLTLNPRNPYILINDMPKIENLRRIFPAVYRAEPKLVRAASAPVR